MKVQVCTGKSCRDKFCKYIITRIERDISFYDLKGIDLEQVTCMGECRRSPNVKIQNQIHNYSNPSRISELIIKQQKQGKSITHSQET